MEWVKITFPCSSLIQPTKGIPMIKLPYNKRISNVVLSTIMGHGGMGMFPYILFPKFWVLIYTAWKNKILIIAKSATRYRRIGNFIWWKPWTWRFVHRIKNKGSVLNAFGLTNPGVLICAIQIRIACMLGFNVIPSFFVDFSKSYSRGYKEALEAMHIYEKILGKYFYIIEWNPSCPNSGESISSNQTNVLKITKTLKQKFSHITFIVKGSIIYPKEFYAQLEQAGADIIHTMNTIPFDVAVKIGISPYQKSPLGEKTKGGYSGKIISKPAFDHAETAVIPSTTIPLIFGGGISDFADMCKYDIFLASQKNCRNYSFAICTAAAFDPIGIVNLIKGLN